MVDLTEVKGIGPATAVKLHAAGINTAEKLSKSEAEHLIIHGIGKASALKIIQAAKEAIGSQESISKDSPKTEEPKQEKVSTSPKKEKVVAEKKVVKTEQVVEDIGPKLSDIKGLGKKIESILNDNGISTVEELAKTDPEALSRIDGISENAADKITKGAADMLGLPAPGKERQKAEKKKEELKKAAKEGKLSEDQRSPLPMGIPTKKKRGVQIRTTADQDEPIRKVKKKEGWVVKKKELSPDEIEERRKRMEEMSKSSKITRDIPQRPLPVKAQKTSKSIKTEKPVKKLKEEKPIVVKKEKKKTKAEVYYTTLDLQPKEVVKKPKSGKETTGQPTPRISVEKNTYLGRVSSHRRSRRVKHERQLIVDLNDEFHPEMLLGQNVYVTYPDNEQRVSGSVTKRFGKPSSKKVLVNFKKGIRLEAISQKVYIK
ncbi:MAG: helix-hairpin-helix domain-containing protein [Candidatus Heimdallarchaeota archaeon]|nr:helix-hairpin-helix domain-containing protein [Candidatus Heimdallarchaeota archaeon]MDH5644794.1 helix-hairpin-helix domain-containing protein [Candidatus Heimdallarchaeota archaeon]